MAFEIGYHIIIAARIPLWAGDVFAVTPFMKYRLCVAGTSSSESRLACGSAEVPATYPRGTQYSYRDAPAPLDAHRQLFLPNTDYKPKDSRLAGHSRLR